MGRTWTALTMVVLTGEILVDLVGANAAAAATRAYTGVLGGSALNTASVLAGLGAPVRFVGELGDDALGTWALAQIVARGIEASALRRLPAPTPLALAELDAAGNATYTFYRLFGATPFAPPVAAVAEAQWFHFGSLSSFDPRVVPGLLRLLEAAKAVGARISFDPNLRRPPTAAYRAQLAAYLPFVDVLKASADDSAWLFPDVPAAERLAALAAWGVPLTVLTDGAAGASAREGEATVWVPGVPVTVVDTIGAGDTFSAGLIWGRLRGWSLERTLEAANALAAQACTVRGAGLPPEALAPWR